MAPQQQYPAGVLLDASGNPFAGSVPGEYYSTPAAPPGAYLPAGYGPTTIVIEAGGGKIELTESDSATRVISYADIYASQPAVAAVIGKLVRQLSTLPLKVYQRPANGQSQNGRAKHPEEIDDPNHPLVKLLRNPAPGYGMVSLLEWIALPMFVHGNSLIAKFRAGGDGTPPTEVIPLDWRFLQAWARLGQPVLVWATVQTGNLKWIAPSETVFTAWGSPAGANGAWLGTSPLNQLGTSIKIEEAAQRYSASYFQNAARPGGVITLPPEVNVRQAPQITDRLQKKIEEAYGGVDAAFKVAVLGGGATWKPWGQTAQEAQLIHTRQWDRDEVRDVFDMPSNGDTMNPERDAQFYKTTLRPHTVMIADRLNSQLVDPEPEWKAERLFVRISMDEVLWGDPLVLSDKMSAEVLAGLRSVDEARIPLGLQPRGGKHDLLLADQLPLPPGDGSGPGAGAQETPLETNVHEARDITAIRRV